MTPPLYFDDLHVGDRFRTGSRALSAAAVKAFAQEFDPQPFHLDEGAAQASMFRGLAASGWHVAALTMRLLVEGGPALAGGIIGAGVQLEWNAPTRPDDVLHVDSVVVELIPSRSRPERGIVVLKSETINESGQVVQTQTAKLVVPRRPA
jgi:acyl dehydratase